MQAKDIFARMDLDSDGKVSLVEFKSHLGVPLKDYESMFDMLDTDKSGFIEFNELWADFTRRGVHMTEQEVRAVFASLDQNKDGKVSLMEFKAHLSIPLRDYMAITDPQAAFDRMDSNKDGFIEFQELFDDVQKRNIGLTEKEVRVPLVCIVC